MNEIHARIAEDMAAALGDEDVTVLILGSSMLDDKCNRLLRQGCFQEALEEAEAGIQELEQHIASNPSTKTVLGFTLARLYSMKAMVYTQLGQTDVSLKRQALQYTVKSLQVTNLPPQFGAILFQLKQVLEKEIGSP